MERRQGQVALITGVTSGIGRELARRLVAEGFKVAGCGRRKERLTELQTELGESFLGLQVDLQQEAEIPPMFEQVKAQFGPVNVLVNNAGLGKSAPLSAGPSRAWRAMLEINVLALAICTQLAVAQMQASGSQDGMVIHISSMSAHRIPAGSGMYSATKYAVRSLTEGLRKELRAENSPLRVTSISPGFVETEFAQVLHGGDTPAARETYERYRVLQPGDIAETLSMLLRAPNHVQFHDLLLRPTKQES